MVVVRKRAFDVDLILTSLVQGGIIVNNFGNVMLKR